MKKYVYTLVVGLCASMAFSSCEKQNEDKHVTLNETVKSGDTYTLDVSAYAGKKSEASITKQAGEYTVSQIDYDAASGRNLYHFSTDTKEARQENVVIVVTEKGNGRCMEHDSKNKTEIALNLDVQQ